MCLPLVIMSLFLFHRDGLLAILFATTALPVMVNLSQATDGAFIMAMEPVVTIVLAFLILKESLDSKTLGGLALALMGFIVLSSTSFNSNQLSNGHWLGNLFFLLAIIGEYSLPILFKQLLTRYSPQLVAFYCLLFASFYMLPFQGTALWTTIPKLHATTWIAVLYLGLGCSFLACFLWLTCLKHLSVSMVALSWFLQPVIGCLIAWAVLREPITPQIFVGGSFIIAALGLLSSKLYEVAEPALQTQQNVTQKTVTIMRVQHPLWGPRPLTPIRVQRSPHTHHKPARHHPLMQQHFPLTRYRSPHHIHTMH